MKIHKKFKNSLLFFVCLIIFPFVFINCSNDNRNNPNNKNEQVKILWVYPNPINYDGNFTVRVSWKLANSPQHAWIRIKRKDLSFEECGYVKMQDIGEIQGINEGYDVSICACNFSHDCYYSNKDYEISFCLWDYTLCDYSTLTISANTNRTYRIIDHSFNSYPAISLTSHIQDMQDIFSDYGETTLEFNWGNGIPNPQQPINGAQNLNLYIYNYLVEMHAPIQYDIGLLIGVSAVTGFDDNVIGYSGDRVPNSTSGIPGRAFVFVHRIDQYCQGYGWDVERRRNLINKVAIHELYHARTGVTHPSSHGGAFQTSCVFDPYIEKPQNFQNSMFYSAFIHFCDTHSNILRNITW